MVPGDVVDLARDVLRHRIVPSFAALAEEVNADMILDRLISAVPVPRVAQDSLLARAEAAERGPSPAAQTAPVADYAVGAGSRSPSGAAGPRRPRGVRVTVGLPAPPRLQRGRTRSVPGPARRPRRSSARST